MIYATIPSVKFDKLYLFSFTWAVATVLHSLSFPERISLQHPFGLAVIVATALVILIPQAIWPFLLMLFSSAGNTFEWMPYAPNHITFEFIINIGLLVALTWSIVRYRSKAGIQPISETLTIRNALFNSFAPALRISLLILYFYAVLHKLNWDYFNVNISCSTFLLEGYAGRLPFLPHNAVVRWLAVWGTIAIETAIPLFLCFKRTRSTGILLGFGFHYFLAIHPHQGLYSFSAMLFALYALFVPADFPDKVQLLAKNVLGDAHYRVTAAFRAVASISVLVLVVLALSGFTNKVSRIGFPLWLGWGLFLVVTYVFVSSRNKLEPERFSTLFRVRPAAFWLVPLLVFFNGMNPYLGLKTQSSFSMFSNLRTEGGTSNHLLIPNLLQVTYLQHDLVDVTDTDLNALKRFVANDQLITYFEFRRIASETKTNFYANYIRKQQTQTLSVRNGISNRPELTTPHHWLIGKLVRFRPVDKGPCLCKH